VIGSLCLTTDLATGLPIEHLPQSTLLVLRRIDRLGLEAEFATPTYYDCLLSHTGCTTDADLAAALFPDGALLEHFNPVICDSPAQTMRAILHVLSDPDRFAFSGSIRWRDACQWPLVVSAGGQLKLPELRRKLGLRGLVGDPRSNGPRNGPSSTGLMLAHDRMTTDAL
jgi:hypothetical protein